MPLLLLPARSLMELVTWVSICVSARYCRPSARTREAPPATRSRSVPAIEENGSCLAHGTILRVVSWRASGYRARPMPARDPCRIGYLAQGTLAPRLASRGLPSSPRPRRPRPPKARPLTRRCHGVRPAPAGRALTRAVPRRCAAPARATRAPRSPLSRRRDPAIRGRRRSRAAPPPTPSCLSTPSCCGCGGGRGDAASDRAARG